MVVLLFGKARFLRSSAVASAKADAAVRGFDELDRLRLWNAAWWATEGVPFYKPLLRWYLAALQEVQPGPVKQELYARAATCYYRLGLYEKWEAGQVLCGKTPARHIEKAIRWDGVHNFEGKGFETVNAYVARQTTPRSGDTGAESPLQQERRR